MTIWRIIENIWRQNILTKKSFPRNKQNWGAANEWELNQFKVCTYALKTGGNSVVAYVYTLYGAQPIADIKIDILKYLTDFGENLIDGLFLDETATIYQPGFIKKYKEIADFIHDSFSTKIPMVIGNPGASPDSRIITG